MPLMLAVLDPMPVRKKGKQWRASLSSAQNGLDLAVCYTYI